MGIIRKSYILLSVIITVFLFSACSQGSGSIGIIGGADGPTSVFIASGKGDQPSPGNTEDYEEDNKVQNPVATIEMENGGIIVVELYPDKAGNTVNNFISLANSGFYDGLIFHRVIPDFMIQGGDPLGNGTGGPGYTIEGEFANNGHTENDILHVRGVISMARRGDRFNPEAAYDTAGSQFFIMVEDSPHLDGDYAAFGKVIDGMDVVDEIVSVKTDRNDKPVEDQRIKTIRVDTFGVEYPEPITIAD